MFVYCCILRKVFAGLLRLWNPKESSKLSQAVAVNVDDIEGISHYMMYSHIWLFQSFIELVISFRVKLHSCLLFVEN